MTNLEKYKSIFSIVLGVSEEVLDDRFTFKAVEQWDSVAHLTLISDLEDAFGIMFDPDDILHFGSFENGKRILNKYGIEL